jgi:hypothetical protein
MMNEKYSSTMRLPTTVYGDFYNQAMVFMEASRSVVAMLMLGAVNSQTQRTLQGDDQIMDDQSMPMINNNAFPYFDGGVYMSGSLNSGDTAWMLVATALVLLMTMPGLAIYYSGMVRNKNVLACTMQIFTITCLITFLWLCFGYSLAFSPAQSNGNFNEVYGNGDRLWLRGMMMKTSHMLAPTIPEVSVSVRIRVRVTIL